jgi:WD40 repeat protein
MCMWSPCGTKLIAAGGPATAYLWAWKPTGTPLIPAQPSLNAEEQPLPSLCAPLARHLWPPFTELAQLRGHREPVSAVKWSSSGSAVATASSDGSVRVYSECDAMSTGASSSATAAASSWQAAAVMECVPLGIGRSKKCEVLQIEWSLEDATLMAVVSDMTVRVFHVATGEHLHTLAAHTGKVFELSVHPRIPNLLATWARDGAIIIWDHSSGQILRRFSTSETYPGRGRWARTEPLAALEGAWAPDGDSLFVTDAAGQLHIYGLSSATTRSRAHYDQFFCIDYQDLTIDPLTHIARGMASGRPLHLERGARAPIAYDGTPYTADYRRLAMANRLTRGALPNKTLPPLRIQKRR